MCVKNNKLTINSMPRTCYSIAGSVYNQSSIDLFSNALISSKKWLIMHYFANDVQKTLGNSFKKQRLQLSNVNHRYFNQIMW